MLRHFIIGLMKVLLDLQIILSLIAGAIVIAMTARLAKHRHRRQLDVDR